MRTTSRRPSSEDFIFMNWEPCIRSNPDAWTKKPIVSGREGFTWNVIRMPRLSHEQLQDVGTPVYIMQDGTWTWRHEPSPLHLRRLKSQHQGNHCGIPPPPPLLPLHGFCLGERCYNPSSPSGVYPLLHRVLVPVHRWLPLMKFSSPLYPALPLHLA